MVELFNGNKKLVNKTLQIIEKKGNVKAARYESVSELKNLVYEMDAWNETQ